MKQLYRGLVLAILLLIALSLYSYGHSTGVFIFIILGFLFEATFWLKLFKRKSKANQKRI